MPPSPSSSNPLKTLMNAEQCFPIVTTIFFSIIYIICFVALFSPKSEMVATGLLMTLSIMSVIYIIPRSFMNNSNIYFLPEVVSKSLAEKVEPLIGVSKIGILRFSSILIIISAMLLCSVALLIMSFAKVRDNAMADEKSVGIDFGNQRAAVDNSKRLIIAASVFLWTLHISCDNQNAILTFMKDYLSPEFSANAKGSSLEKRAREGDITKINAFNTLISAATLGALSACIFNTFNVATLVGAISR